MDFDLAAKRLERDQTKLRGSRRATVGGGRNAPALSEQAQREAARRKQQQQRLAEQRARQLRQREAMESYLRQCERNLGVKHLSQDTTHGLRLKATSIHGEGDKIALPPSVLETLTQSSLFSDMNQQQQQQPWTFRVGILNPDYTFPASPLLQTVPFDDGESSVHEDEDDDDDDDDDEGNDTSASKTAIYLDELRHKYRAYTHATVVEFTQEEGYVGLPEPIARALLQQASDLETTRTVDKATVAAVVPILDETDNNNNNSAPMEIDYQDAGDGDQEKTPGHLAWGAFDVPVNDIEITMVQLPKGRTAKLLPSPEAIRNGFYNLKDIKMVLEQSLIRTRATLSVGDNIHTWHRGKKFDLTVTQVSPASYRSVSCINTDIEIDFESPSSAGTGSSAATSEAAVAESMGVPLGGRRLGEATSSVASMATTTTTPSSSKRLSASSPATIHSTAHTVNLPPEPPTDQKEGVVSVQIRSSTVKGQRRLNVRTATVRDLFALATSLGVGGDDATSFSLVTRLPRRVFRLDEQNADQTLEQAGISSGQELFMVEKL